MSQETKRVARHYDYLQTAYQKLWAQSTLAIHYGIWDRTTGTHKDALINTNKLLARTASISSNDFVLDSGCGMGGSCIWLAETHKVAVAGITNSNKQASFFSTRIRASGLSHLVSVSVQDYLNTAFCDESFNVVWAIESIFHTNKKQQFIREAFRLLKPAGRLVLADGFASSDKMNQNMYQTHPSASLKRSISQGYLVDIDNFIHQLKWNGFKNITFQDYTQAIVPSAEQIYAICRPLLPLAKVLQKAGRMPFLVNAVLGGVLQKELIHEGWCQYGVIRAEKP